jgi:DNA-binding response OmpR family regulator
MEEPTNILVVDGDPAARRRISQSIEPARIHCMEAATAREALDAVRKSPPALVVLDLYLPDLSGLGLSRMIRETPTLENVPIMVVSEHASEMDRILAFEMGVDDFLPKPFYPPELAARVQTILRSVHDRNGHAASPDAGVSQRVKVDRTAARIEIDGKLVDLTVTEFEILAILVERAGRVVRRRELIELLRGPQAGQSDRAIDAHVKSIRRKLGAARDALQTVRGIGYRLDEPET